MMADQKSLDLKAALKLSKNDIRRIMKTHSTSHVSLIASDRASTTHMNFTSADQVENIKKDYGQQFVLYGIASASKLFIAYLLQYSVEILSYEREECKMLRNCWHHPFTHVLEQASRGRIRIRLDGNPSVLDLLSHVRGFPSMNDALLNVDGYPLLSKEDFIRISPVLMNHASKSKRHSVRYSNANFIWLEILLEHAFQEPIGDLLQKHIMRPVGMKHTFISFDEIPSGMRQNVAEPQVQRSDGSCSVGDPGRYACPSAVSIALGMFSCTEDLNLFYDYIRTGLDSPYNSTDQNTLRDFWLEYLGRGSNISRNSRKTSSSSSLPGPISFTSEERIEGAVYFCSLGLVTELNSSGPGISSMNRLLPATQSSSSYKIQSKGKPVDTVYAAWARTGYSGASYFMPEWGFVLIVLCNSGPFDSADHIARLFIQNLLDLNPPTMDIAIADLCDSTEADRHKNLAAWESTLLKHRPPLAGRDQSPLVNNLVGEYRSDLTQMCIRLSLDHNELRLSFQHNLMIAIPSSKVEQDGENLVIIPNEICNDHAGDWKCRTLSIKNGPRRLELSHDNWTNVLTQISSERRE